MASVKSCNKISIKLSLGKRGYCNDKSAERQNFGSTAVELKHIVEGPVKCTFLLIIKQIYPYQNHLFTLQFRKMATCTHIQGRIELETVEQNVATITTSPVDYSFSVSLSLDSISAAFLSPVYVPHREEGSFPEQRLVIEPSLPFAIVHQQTRASGE